MKTRTFIKEKLQEWDEAHKEFMRQGPLVRLNFAPGFRRTEFGRQLGAGFGIREELPYGFAIDVPQAEVEGIDKKALKPFVSPTQPPSVGRWY